MIEIIDGTKEFQERLNDVKQRDEYHIEKAKLEFSSLIFEAMEREKINQNELADRIGSSRQYVSKVLHGFSNLTIASMVKIARALNMKLDIRFIDGEPSVNVSPDAKSKRTQRKRKSTARHSTSMARN